MLPFTRTIHLHPPTPTMPIRRRQHRRIYRRHRLRLPQRRRRERLHIRRVRFRKRVCREEYQRETRCWDLDLAHRVRAGNSFDVEGPLQTSIRLERIPKSLFKRIFSLKFDFLKGGTHLVSPRDILFLRNSIRR